MTTPTLTITIELKNPVSNETTTIKKGPFNIAHSILPKNLLQAIINLISTLILGLNSNPNAKNVVPTLLLDDVLMYNSDKFKVNTIQSQAYLQTTIKSNDGNFSFLASNSIGSIEIIKKPKQPVYQSMLSHDTYEILTPDPPQ